VLVPGAGHSVYFEQPETFNRIALEFLDPFWS
jgi:pimeloyl-ACP methyl ester carboxylesterase